MWYWYLYLYPVLRSRVGVLHIAEIGRNTFNEGDTSRMARFGYPQWPKGWMYRDSYRVASHWPRFMPENYAIAPAIQCCYRYRTGNEHLHGDYWFQRQLEFSTPDWWRYEPMYLNQMEDQFVNIEGRIIEDPPGTWSFKLIAEIVFYPVLIAEKGYVIKEYWPDPVLLVPPWSIWWHIDVHWAEPKRPNNDVQVFPVTGCVDFPDHFIPSGD